MVQVRQTARGRDRNRKLWSKKERQTGADGEKCADLVVRLTAELHRFFTMLLTNAHTS